MKRPWVITDDAGQDAIAIRPIMNLTLTYDHRLVDGAYAAASSSATSPSGSRAGRTATTEWSGEATELVAEAVNEAEASVIVGFLVAAGSAATFEQAAS